MKSIVLAIASFLILFSCDYEPAGENFVVRPQPDATGVSVELTDTSDTLYVFGNAEIRYSSITQNRPVLWFRAYLNGELFGTHNQQSASVFLYTPNLSDGCHSLRLELIVSSGTGSLAERQGQEEIRIERDYVVCIDNSRPDPVEITSIRRVDGTLELAWEKSNERFFKYYTIVKSSFNQASQQFEIHWIKDINDSETISLRDSTFIGGQVKYSVSVGAANQQSEGSEKTFVDPYELNPTWEWVDNNNNIKLTWRRTKYYKNFTSYSISFSYSSFDDRTFSVTNVDDTTLTLDPQLPFPSTKALTVITYPFVIDNFHHEYVYGHSDNIYIGKDFPWYRADIYEDKSIYNETLDKYFAIALTGFKTELVKINAQTNEIEQSYELIGISDILLSNNGQYLYIAAGSGFFQIDPMTFTFLQYIDLSALCGSSGGYNWKGSISDNNRLALTNGCGNFVLDLTGHSILQQWPFEQKSIEISPSGAFVIRGNEILKWNSSNYVSAGNTGNTRQRIFIQNDAKVLLDKSSHVDVLNLTTMAVEHTITLDKAYDLRYDPVSGLLGGITDPFTSQPRLFNLYTLTSNEKVKEFPVAGGVVLMNNSLVTPGYITSLDHYYP